MASDLQVVVFASQKGGSGKTTLAGHMAVAAQESGAGPVALIDTDPQGSLAKWWNARDAEMPVYVETSIPQLATDIGRLREGGFRLVIIDTPPAVTTSISNVVQHADLVVVPTRPSPHDLRAVGATVDIVEAADKPLVFVVNSATARARITGETAVSLSQHGTVAPVTIHNRVDFAASMIDGRTVGEVNPSSRSAKEISLLWSYLAERLRRIDPAHTATEPGASRFGVELLTPGPASAPRAAPREAPQRPAATGYQAPDMSDAEEDEDDYADIAQVELPRRKVASPLPLDESLTVADILGLQDQKPGVAPARQSPQETATDQRTERREMARAAIWDGIDRRRNNDGPPPGVHDRRRAPIFGRRPIK